MENNLNLKVNLIDDEKSIINKVKVQPINNGKHINKPLESSILGNDEENLIPIIFFINKKSGSSEGEQILKLIPKEVIVN